MATSPASTRKQKDQFDVKAYLESLAPKESIDFFGITIPVPTDTPLSYTLRAQEIQESSAEDPSNILTLLADFLGQDVADAIEKRDPGVRAIGALLLWAGKNASGDVTDFPTAYQEYLENEKESLAEAKESEGEGGDEEGKPQLKVVSPNREQRRAAASGRKSAKTSR